MSPIQISLQAKTIKKAYTVSGLAIDDESNPDALQQNATQTVGSTYVQYVLQIVEPQAIEHEMADHQSNLDGSFKHMKPIGYRPYLAHKALCVGVQLGPGLNEPT